MLFARRARRLDASLVLLLTVLPAMAACSGSPVGPSASPAASTFLAFSSEKDDAIGQGESHRYTLADGVWGATYTINNAGKPEISVSIVPASGNAWWWTLHVTAPRGQRLAVGTYEAAGRWPSEPANQPGLEFSGSGRSCQTLTGRFVISDFVLGADNNIDSLHATFEQHCDGRAAALSGEIVISRNDWR